MTKQISLFDLLDDVKEDLYYITWDSKKIENGKVRIAKGYNDGLDSFKQTVEKAMKAEIDEGYPKVVRTGAGLKNWYEIETIPEPKMALGIEITPEKGNELNLLDEGTFKVKFVGVYKCGTTDYPWAILSSAEHGYDVVMSFKTISNKVLRKKSPHKDLNFTLIDSIDDTAAFFFTVGHLLNRQIALHLRTTPKTHTDLTEKYERVTGHRITEDIFNKYVYLNTNPGTFTDNADLRVDISPIRKYLYFPKNNVGKREGKVNKGTELIQNTSYVWTLFNYGFRLGTEHDVDGVFGHVRIQSPEYFEDFERGYNYYGVEN